MPRPLPAKYVIVNRELTQRNVAASVGVNEHTFSRILNGYVAPWPALRRRLSDYLAIPEADLFDNVPAGVRA